MLLKYLKKYCQMKKKDNKKPLTLEERLEAERLLKLKFKEERDHYKELYENIKKKELLPDINANKVIKLEKEIGDRVKANKKMYKVNQNQIKLNDELIADNRRLREENKLLKEQIHNLIKK